MAEEKLIRIRWHADRTKDPCEYVLSADDAEHSGLKVSISSAEVSERVAKARLMERMYQLGSEMGIPARLLRFKINGVDE